MSAANVTYTLPDFPSSFLREDGIESGFIGKLQGLKYEYRPDITNRATLEKNFREKFEALISVKTQKHEALKTHKKGLMQQFFPAPTEPAHTSEGQGPGLFPSPEELEG